MTTKTGKPKGPDQPVMAAADGPALQNGDADTVVQPDKDNGGVAQPAEAVIGRDIQGHLGKKLKDSYDDLVRQPVPDTFRQLLDELERREKKK